MNAVDIEKEIESISSFPDEDYFKIIREVGFVCDFCGKCCTSEFNDHVFLIDDDAKRIIENCGREFLRPAPYFDLCDNLGRFYVMGYAMKTKPNGDCIFYIGGRCLHYEVRPLICKIYPYMLHREPDEEGNIEFRQIGGLDLHGSYHNEISEKMCEEILKSVRDYESGFLRQKLGFIKEIERYFKENNLRNSKQMYDRMIRQYQKGKTIEVYIFFQGRFEKEVISKQINNPE
ncbi:MAG: YkgJ family cysteine cluster protein [Candidatus Methanoperedens sp.]